MHKFYTFRSYERWYPSNDNDILTSIFMVPIVINLKVKLPIESMDDSCFPGRRFRWPDPEEACRKETEKNAGSCRNTLEVIRTWRQYSSRKILGFFPVIFDQFLAGKHRKVIGMHRKKSGNFPAGILLPCSGDFCCIPAGSVPYSLTWVLTNSDTTIISCQSRDRVWICAKIRQTLQTFYLLILMKQ